MARINGLKQWLARALRVNGEPVPQLIDIERVWTVVDLHQGGWSGFSRGLPADGSQPPDSSWSPNGNAQAAGAGAKTETVLAEIPGSGYLVAGLCIRRVGAGPNPAAVRIYLDHPATSGEVDLFSASLNIDTRTDWRTIGGGAPYWIIPPNTALKVDFPVTTVDTWDLQLIKLWYPEGSKPI